MERLEGHPTNKPLFFHHMNKKSYMIILMATNFCFCETNNCPPQTSTRKYTSNRIYQGHKINFHL